MLNSGQILHTRRPIETMKLRDLIVFVIALGGFVIVLVIGAPVGGVTGKAAPVPTPDPHRVAACLKVELPGKVAFKQHSFAYDAKPYEGSCFVTFAEKGDMV